MCEPFEFLHPRTPAWLVPAALSIERGLEATPGAWDRRLAPDHRRPTRTLIQRRLALRPSNGQVLLALIGLFFLVLYFAGLVLAALRRAVRP